MSSTSGAHQQADPSLQPSSSRPDPSTTGPHRPGLNRTSILLIVAFLLCFTGFIYLSSKIPRITLTVQATSSRHRRQKGKRRKPKIWEVSLDDDPSNVLKHLVAIYDWRVSYLMHVSRCTSIDHPLYISPSPLPPHLLHDIYFPLLRSHIHHHLFSLRSPSPHGPINPQLCPVGGRMPCARRWL